jgi:opacity protein-like surface antigen
MNKTMITLAIAGTVAFSAASFAQSSGVYVGGALGVQGAQFTDPQWGATASLGYRFNRFLAAEAMFDFNDGTRTLPSNQFLTGVVTVGIPLGPVTPYVLAGAGYGFGGITLKDTGNSPVWTVGAGATYSVNRNWQIDARWRRVENFNDRDYFDRITLGVNFRF